MSFTKDGQFWVRMDPPDEKEEDEAPYVSTFYHVYGSSKYHKVPTCASYRGRNVVSIPLTQDAAQELRERGHLCGRCAW